MLLVTSSNLARFSIYHEISRDQIPTITQRNVTNFPSYTWVCGETPRLPLSGLWIPAVVLRVTQSTDVGKQSIVICKVVSVWYLVRPALAREARACMVDCSRIVFADIPTVDVGVVVSGVVGLIWFIKGIDIFIHLFI